MTQSLTASDAANYFRDANRYYQNKQYAEAERLYQLALKQDPRNPVLLYNLGNACYHLKQYPQALLYYERAAKWNPEDAALAHNIALTQSKLLDKVEFSREFFLVKWVRSQVYGASSSGWNTRMLVLLWLGTMGCLVYFFTTRKGFVKIGVILLLCAGMCYAFSRLTFDRERNPYAAILMETTVLHKSPVENAYTRDTLKVGTKVDILDRDKDWYKIRKASGKSGWIERKKLGLI